MKLRAFQGLRPAPRSVENVASLPYDVVNRQEAAGLAKDNPLSMLHVVRAEIDLPEVEDPYSEPVYAKAAENFQRLQDEGHLIREDKPAIYVYQQQMGDHVQKGIAAVCHVQDYDNDVIKKHEKTRQAKEDDRTRLTSELSANPGPVFLTYQDKDSINGIVDSIVSGEPIYDFTAEDGIRHTVWVSYTCDSLIDEFAGVPRAYVADGHHRSASAARVGKERADANPSHTGHEDYNWFLAVLFPESELKVLPYNRVILNSPVTGEDLLGRLRVLTDLTEDADPSPSQPGQVSVYVNGKWYGMTLNPEPGADPVSSLDVQMLQTRVLQPIFGIDDPRTSDDIDFVGGIRGTDFLEQLVDSGKAACAFSMYPVTVQQLMDIADANQIMPPKSTWFEPKLRSGLFIHTFEKPTGSA
jgi:uncharacterized protein (DUF1015 family)